MKLIIAFMFYACSGCGMADKLPTDVNGKNDNPPKYSMQDHNPIFDEYTTDFPSNTKQIPIVFVEDMKDKAGVCYRWPNGHREVEINETTWVNYSDSQRRWLIWHELGHCELDMGHMNVHMNDDDEVCVEEDGDDEHKCQDHTMLSVMRWHMPHDYEISNMCAREETDGLSRAYCDSLGLWTTLLLKFGL